MLELEFQPTEVSGQGFHLIVPTASFGLVRSLAPAT